MMIVRMISGTSLSAFSASVAQTRAGQGASVAGVRQASGSPLASPGSPPFTALKSGVPPQDSSRPLPRGSLLDLSV